MVYYVKYDKIGLVPFCFSGSDALVGISLGLRLGLFCCRTCSVQLCSLWWRRRLHAIGQFVSARARGFCICACTVCCGDQKTDRSN